MTALQTIRRVTVYAAHGLEAQLLERFLTLGAKGYTITETRGKGEHATVDDPLARSTQVRIELLVQAEVAVKIMEYIRTLTTKHLAIAACAENVEVCRPEHF